MKASDLITQICEGDSNRRWPGFKRVGGRLTGPMPYGFFVHKPIQNAKPTEDWVNSGEANQGSVKYLSPDGRRMMWMDSDDINLADMASKIEPYGVY